MAGRAHWLAVAATLIATAAEADVPPHDPTRAVVWIRADSDREILERVRGQVADLDVDLIVVDDHPARPRRGREDAGALGRQRDADIVIWFRARAASTSVYIADLTNDRLLVREVDHDGDTALARSAALEAAAIVVRSSVRALAAGGTIGVSEPVLARPPPAPEPKPTAVVAAPTPPAAPPPARSWRAFAAVGYNGAFTDGDTRGHHGLLAAFGVVYGRWRAGVEGSLGSGVDYRDAMTRIRVTRTAAAARVEARIVGGGRAEIGGSLAAGATVFSRTTVSAPDLEPTPPARTVTAVISPGLHVRVRAPGSPIAVELGAAADIMTSPPEFGYEVGGTFTRGSAFWPVAPRVAVTVVVESP